MVYCGKPSKGCGQCRTRKIRCDQARPACSQCVRAKRDCPGYRDQLSLMFRDESKSVVRKAVASSSSSSDSSTRSRQKRSPARLPRIASPGGNLTTLAAVEPAQYFNLADPQLDYTMQRLSQMPLEVQPLPHTSKQEVICYFLRGNAIPGSLWMGDFVTQFLAEPGATASQRAMQSSVIAVSSAMLCRVRKMTSLKEAAQKEYVSALNLLNTALADVEEAKSNHALGAVVLLAVYEVVTSRAPRDIDQWTNHITGATALLDLRGTEQLKTEIGLRLFLHLRYQIVISCIQRDARVPQSLLECTKYAMFLRPGEAHSNRLIMIIGRLSNLRADIHEKILTDHREIISMASSIEAELVAWLAALPPDFTYETHTKSPHDFLFQERCRGLALYDDQYHEYPSLWVCNTWNQYRCARILVSEIILSRMKKLSDSSSIRLLSDEFRQHSKRFTQLPPPESYVGGIMLLWPLFLAGIVENPHHPLRRWVIQCLKMVGHSYGLDQALAVMDIVAVDPGIPLVEGERTVAEEYVADEYASPEALPDLHFTQIPTSADVIF
ncbi:uncharacterized protein N7482_006118 [Penicillium canariense]|uniref:Zn(2)-C6 fungal-type domain-containing protein n=1 Tax=Penicillium canariense TaxID=189055 RepID=A0A9W9LN68_9EURO|nr:uncharacterized protein N7482_006118 [Penicillium canariense]KAJ5167337.1 hypothetical protein N7482_006118 [Penicillium canariense]